MRLDFYGVPSSTFCRVLVCPIAREKRERCGGTGGSRVPLPLVVLALQAEPTILTHRLPPQAQHSLKGRVVEKSEEAGGVLGTCVLVPDILQDVHFIHSLDLLLLLWPSPSSWWARCGGHSWLPG